MRSSMRLLTASPVVAETADTPANMESFHGLLLRRGTGLSQCDRARRLGPGLRTVQGREAGVSHPSGERLEALDRGASRSGWPLTWKQAPTAGDRRPLPPLDLPITSGL